MKSIYLITGGTGTLGKGLLKRLGDAKEIRVYSRSIKTQLPLQHKYPNVKFIAGDVRDLQAVKNAMHGVDIVIHAGAFKYADLSEAQARECAMVNVVGTVNVIDAAIAEPSVKKVLGISSDKALSPSNVYGATKHIMEKLFAEANQHMSTKQFSCVRYCNVLGSTGSVLTIWKKQKAENKPLTVTDKRMRRFFFTISEAVDLVMYALENMRGGEIFATKAKSYSLYEMAQAISTNIIETGMRPGEKLNETLISDYEGEEFTTEQSGNNEVVIIGGPATT